MHAWNGMRTRALPTSRQMFSPGNNTRSFEERDFQPNYPGCIVPRLFSSQEEPMITVINRRLHQHHKSASTSRRRITDHCHFHAPQALVTWANHRLGSKRCWGSVLRDGSRDSREKVFRFSSPSHPVTNHTRHFPLLGDEDQILASWHWEYLQHEVKGRRKRFLHFSCYFCVCVCVCGPFVMQRSLICINHWANITDISAVISEANEVYKHQSPSPHEPEFISGYESEAFPLLQEQFLKLLKNQENPHWFKIFSTSVCSVNSRWTKRSAGWGHQVPSCPLHLEAVVPRPRWLFMQESPGQTVFA